MLVGATAVLPALIYLITIVSYAKARKNVKFWPDSFTLGRFSKPIFISAVVWLIVEICILTIPKDFHNVSIVSGLMVLIGVILYFVFFYKKTDRKPLKRF